MGNAMGIPVFFARNLSHSKVEAGAYCPTETDLSPDAEYLSDDEIRKAVGALSPERMAERVLSRLAAQDGQGRAADMSQA